MDNERSSALTVAHRYFDAWTSGDVDGAMALVHEDIVCAAPAGTIHGVAAFRDFLEPFARSLTASQMLGAFGDDAQALIMYDTSTPLVASAPAAELLTIMDGRITANTFIFDRAPFIAARAAASAV